MIDNGRARTGKQTGQRRLHGSVAQGIAPFI
jgi:hypothetical protein